MGSGSLLVDPYLSDSVEHAEGVASARLRPSPYAPSELRDVKAVLITHEHLDHCDPDTLRPLAAANPAAVFHAPGHLVPVLRSWGLNATAAHTDWTKVAGARVASFRTSHPEPIDTGPGSPWSVGYAVEIAKRRLLFTGDTSLTDDLITQVRRFAPVHAAFLPVNERNHMREKAGIVGNMTIREAFHLAEIAGASVLVPQHWDMFRANRAFRDEIEAVYRGETPPFKLDFDAQGVSF